jgi:hypothetical protein
MQLSTVLFTSRRLTACSSTDNGSSRSLTSLLLPEDKLKEFIKKCSTIMAKDFKITEGVVIVKAVRGDGMARDGQLSTDRMIKKCRLWTGWQIRVECDGKGRSATDRMVKECRL